MASVFLSYARDDSAKARHVANALEKAGHHVWWDLHVRGGAQFSKVIEEALKAADVVVVLWSARSVESPWVRDEAAAGRDTGRLVPVRLDATDPPLGFRQFQTTDLSRWTGRGSPAPLRTLLADVAEVGGAGDQVEAATESNASAKPAVPAAKWRPKALLSVAGIVTLLLAAAVAYWLVTSRDRVAAVTVAAADSSELSKSIADHVVANLGSAGISATNLRLVDSAAGGRADLRVAVTGSQEPGYVQATVALVSSADMAVLWSKQVQRPAGERAHLEEALAYAVMGALACASDAVGPGSPRFHTDELRSYIDSCVALDNGAEPGPLVTRFRKVMQSAPAFPAGWTNLLRAEIDVLDQKLSAGEDADALRATLRRDLVSGRKAQPDLAEAAAAEAEVQPSSAFLPAMSLIDEAKAAHADDADVLQRRSNMLLRVGRVGEAVDDAERAAGLEPYSPLAHANYIITLGSAGVVDRGWSELAKAKLLWPDSPAIGSANNFMNLRFGDFEKTWRASGGVTTDGGILGYFKILREPSDANIDAWINLAHTHQMLRPHHIFILQALGPLNRVNELYDFVAKWPLEQDLQGITYILFRPWMTNVRRDPRFMRVTQRLGLLDYWEKSGNWPDFCAEPDLPYNCKAEAAKLK